MLPKAFLMHTCNNVTLTQWHSQFHKHWCGCYHYCYYDCTCTCTCI